jgi:hypothetical protein
MKSPAKRRRQLLTPAQAAEHAQKIVDEFNQRFPVGSRIWFFRTLPFGPVVETTVRGEAFTSDSGHAVAFLQGISGFVYCLHVWPVDESRRQDMNFDATFHPDWARRAK